MNHMKIMEILLWTCVGLAFYAYIGHGLLFWLINRIKGLRK